MKAELLSVGTELLLGDILNTNVKFLSKELAGLGISVYYQSVVGDNSERVINAYETGFSRSDLIIVSGGLGPTEDDITKETAAEFFGVDLYESEEVLKSIQERFKKLGSKMYANNKKQALVPMGAKILSNDKGTAPGFIIEKDGKVLILLPGPPYELEHMFVEQVRPFLQEKQNAYFYSRVLRLFGIGESNAAMELKELIQSQTNPTIAPYAKTDEIVFRITARADNEETAKELTTPVAEEIYKKLGKYIYGEGEGISLENVVADLLKEKKMTIAVAESCTGGILASRFVNVPGVSEYFIEGIVTYSNQSKIKRLGVKEETLNKYGAVSKETAEEMAVGICKTSGADIGMSTTGIAGPGGETPDKPVGLVYIGLCIKGKVYTKQLNLIGSRIRIRERSAAIALDMLRRSLIE